MGFLVTLAALIYVVVMSLLKDRAKKVEETRVQKVENDWKIRSDAQKYFYERYTNRSISNEILNAHIPDYSAPSKPGESSWEHHKRLEQYEKDVYERQNKELAEVVAIAMNLPNDIAEMLVKEDLKNSARERNIRNLRNVVLAAKKGVIYSYATNDLIIGDKGWIRSLGAENEKGGVSVFQVMQWVDKELRSHGVPEMIFIPASPSGRIYDPANPSRPYLVRASDKSVAVRGGVFQWNAGYFTVGTSYSLKNFDHFA